MTEEKRDPRYIPIIFSAPMIRAQIEGRKTMTRRLAWKEIHPNKPIPKNAVEKQIGHRVVGATPSPWQKVKPGDVLWVRENVKLVSQEPGGKVGIVYPADGDQGDVKFFDLPEHKLKRTGITPCIHMPMIMSRLLWVVTATKMEPLQNISAEDAKAEGMRNENILGVWSPQIDFMNLWLSLHGPGSWNENPEVVAMSGTVIQQNVINYKREKEAA